MRGDPIADCCADCHTDVDANRITVCESVCTSDVVTDRHTNDWPITCADCVTYGITYGCTFCVSYGITDGCTYGIADVSADCCTDGGSYGGSYG